MKSSSISAQGDWKISGLGLTIPLLGPSGSPTRWEFPMFDGRAPAYVQRLFDYMGKQRTSSALHQAYATIRNHSAGIRP